MAPLVPRLHLFEIDDQPWFPAFLRTRVQSVLTIFWTFQVPLLQSASPAKLVSKLLLQLLNPPSAYAYVDYCAGAGGPTPTIAEEANRSLTLSGADPVKFILTDLFPHKAAWRELSAKSKGRLGYVPESVNAADTKGPVLERRRVLGIDLAHGGNSKTKAAAGTTDALKEFRTFNLAFHHFDDPLARQILDDALSNSSGVGIFELQDRSFASLLMTVLLLPFTFLITPIFFWRDPVHLFFTFVIPIIPFVITFDGIVSSLRVRTVDEVLALLPPDKMKGWKWRSGVEMHTWLIGKLTWMVGVKED